MERNAFLARVAAAIDTAEIPPSGDVPLALVDREAIDLVEVFRTRAQSVNTVVHGPVSRHSAPRAIVGIAAGHNITSFATWDDLPAPGVSAALAAEGWDRIEGDSGSVEEFRSTPYGQVDMGITGASFALAESGSIVLRHHSGRSRLLSVLPDIHVALVRVETIHPTLAHWAQEFPDALDGTANLVIVTGPSRTGDIEQQLNLGVHGPRHMHVVLIR